MTDHVPGPDTKALVREQIQRRTDETDLSKIIDAIEAGTYVSEIPDSRLSTVLPGQWEKMGTLRNELKIERNAIIATLLPEIWLKVRDSWGSIEAEAKHTIYRDDKTIPAFSDALDFQLLTYNQFVYALAAWRIERQKALTKPKDTWTPLDRAFARLELMMPLFNNGGSQIDSATFIARGVGTAMTATWSLIQLVPELAKQKGITLSEKETLQAIRSGYGPIVTTLSSMNIEVGPPLMRGLSKPAHQPGFGFDTKNFDLVPDPKGGYKLSFDHTVLASIKDQFDRTALTVTPLSDTTWCPVRYSARGEVDIMRELFEKCLELARVYYLPYR